MSLTPRPLKTFLALADTLHFGRAAESLGITQSMVSQDIRRLENNLGVRLFNRSTRTVVLTPGGEALLTPAREAVWQLEALAMAAHDIRERRMTAVRVAASPSVINQLLPRAIRQAEADLPRIAIEDVAVETGGVESAVEAGCDIGLGHYLRPARGYTRELLGVERIFGVVAEDHPLATAPELTIRELADTPLLIWPREQHPAYFDAMLETCRAGGLDPMLLITSSRTLVTRSFLVAEGRAFTLIPEPAVKAVPEGTRAVPVEGSVTLPLHLLRRSNERRESVIAFCSIIRRCWSDGGRQPQPTRG